MLLLIMHYWLPILLIVLVIIVTKILHNRSSLRKKLAKIKEQWGKTQMGDRNINLISRYLTSTDQSQISINTSTDLDINNLFEYIDRTNSKPGQQYLYKKLHSPGVSDSYFSTLEQTIKLIEEDTYLRDRVQLKLSSLNSTDAYNLPDLFTRSQQSLFSPLAKGYIIIAPILTILFAISLFTIPNQYAFILLIILLITNVFIHYANKVKILSYTRSLPQLLILNTVCKWLFKHNVIQNDEIIDKSLDNVAKLKNS